MDWLLRRMIRAEEDPQAEEDSQSEEDLQPQVQLPRTPKNKKKGKRVSFSSPETPCDDVFDTPGSVETPSTATSVQSNVSTLGIERGLGDLRLSDKSAGSRSLSKSPGPVGNITSMESDSDDTQVDTPSRKGRPKKIAAANANEKPGKAPVKQQLPRGGPFSRIGRYRSNDKDGKSPAELMQDALSKPLLQSELAEGWIYMLKDPFHYGHVKIGYSKDIRRRHGQHQSDCRRYFDLYFPKDGEQYQDVTPNVVRAEAMIQAELHYFRKWVKCETCERKHKEWFEVNPDIAVEVIKKWIDCMHLLPYGYRDGEWELEKTEISDNFCRLTEGLPDLSKAVVPPKRKYTPRRKS